MIKDAYYKFNNEFLIYRKEIVFIYNIYLFLRLKFK